MVASDRGDDWIADHAEVAARFRAEDIAARFDGSLDGGINACVECCDRHAASGGTALDWEDRLGRRARVGFVDLQADAARFAGLLVSSGIRPGDIVAGLLPRIPELLFVILGTWRAGAVYQPLFTAFGPKAIEHRLAMSGAKLVVTDPANRAKLDPLSARPRVAIVAGCDGEPIRSGDIDVRIALGSQPATFEPVLRHGSDLFLMMSTSGTTGPAKGVPVPLKALLAFYVYMRDAIDLRPDDRFWNIADPGWAYGLYYAITGPLLMGHATTFYDGPFTVESTYDIIERHEITNLAGSPTAFRMLIAAGAAAAAPIKGQLRAVSSAGEPLNPEVIRWFREQFGTVINDHYGQTENGMLVNNHHRLRHVVKPGSAGVTMPGFRIAVVDDAGRELPPNVPGVLAVDMTRSPLAWFEGYWRQPTPEISDGYYRTGDTVEREPDGRISFVGRSDDLITSSGYRIGPFDVESALVEHPAVVEAAAIGKPDPERTEIVKAFVVLAAGVTPDDALIEELRAHVKQRLSAHAYPREIEFVKELPKTPSGKIQRFVLRQCEIAGGGGKV